MTLSRSAAIASLFVVAGVVAFAGQAPQGPGPQGQGPGAPPAAVVPPPAPRGPLSISAAAAAEIVGAVKAPPEFTVTAFAGPPIVNYPTCVTTALDGTVFVCVDRNGSLQADPGMGFILRLVDKNADGQADEYTVFGAMDSPRGAVFDGDTLYVSHPPFVTALRDGDGDGIAEEKRTLVRGLGFGLDFRGADHTTNGIEMGIDGWLYVAVGDYGAVKAVGADGQEIQMRGGGNVRVRPDGSELEIYSRGTRNDYDVAIDPYLNLFARGNTNDGGGFDIRLYHFVAGARFGYPSLFRNFADEVIPPLADYGTGSGTGMLYVHDTAIPAPFGDALYSVDWGRNAIYRHPLQPKGATFTVGQEAFVTVQRPNDMAVDGSSNLYIASWSGGQFRYAGENVGYLARLTHRGTKALPVPNVTNATDAQLADLIISGNQVHRHFAQQALLRRGRTPQRVSLLEQRVLATTGSLAGRTAALFTLKQMAGADANPTLIKVAGADAAIRPLALRALTDRRGELANVPKQALVQALADADPRVQLQAITGLKRIGAVDSARSILPLTASADVVVSNIAIDALVSLNATDASLTALASEPPPIAKGALRVLQQLHHTPAVTGLIASLAEARTPELRSGILQALARLHYHEGVWRGTLAEWWGTRPDTTGPYYDPVGWEESARIRGVLKAALLQTGLPAGAQVDVARLITDLERNRVLPAGGGELLTALVANRDASLPEVADVLLGRVRLDVDPARGRVLDRVARAQPAYRAAVVKMIAAAGPPTPASGEILRATAIDRAVAPAVRASALTALTSAAGTGPDALRRALDAFATAEPGPGVDPAIETAWRQFVSSPAHAPNVGTFRELAAGADQARRVLGYAVLVQLAAEPAAAAGRGGAGGRGGGGGGGGRGRGANPAVEAARTEARAAIDAAWTGPSSASLLRAIGHTAAAGYRERIDTFVTSANAEIRDAATYAASRVPAAAAAAPAAAAATTAAPAAPTVASVPFEQLAGRLATMAGDPAVGRTLFTRQGCVACHTATAGEPEKGPPLAGIATRYSRAEILESIIRPAAKVAQGFATNWFDLTDKRRVEGFVVRESPSEVVLRDLTGAETTVSKAQIANRGVREGSMMPPALADALTLEELASLLAFLGSTPGK